MVGTGACAAEKRSGGSLSPFVGFALHLTSGRSGTARESKEKGLQEREVLAGNPRRSFPETAPGHKPSLKYGALDTGRWGQAAVQTLEMNLAWATNEEGEGEEKKQKKYTNSKKRN